jgi:hypothetical protein
MPILTPSDYLGQVVAQRYRLDRVLSSGGMGVLFRAFDETMQRDVAVKMLKPSHALDADRVARFVRETRIASLVEHPNIARALDVWTEADAAPVLVMELLEGHTLARELELRGVLSLDDTLAIALPIMRALQAVHARGIVHRDLKPSNIFLARGPDAAVTPKLLDFGIAKSPEDVFETQTGVLVGTPGYIAPEQAQSGDASNLTDVWGMAAVLYRCLAGRAPHSGQSAAELLSKLLREPAPPLRAAGVSKRAGATIDRALARSPERRYASIELFARALIECTSAESGTGTRARPRPAYASHARSMLGRAQPMFFGACALSASLAFAPASAGSPAPAPGAALAQRAASERGGDRANESEVAPDRGLGEISSKASATAAGEPRAMEARQSTRPVSAGAPGRLSRLPLTAADAPLEAAKIAPPAQPLQPFTAASLPLEAAKAAQPARRFVITGLPLRAAAPALSTRPFSASGRTAPLEPPPTAAELGRSLAPSRLVEHEATTGLPVATEW